jgi:hypothetical protein
MESQGSCVLLSDVNALGGSNGDLSGGYNQVTFIDYESIVGSTSITSAVFTDYYPKAAVGCRTYNDMKSCQQLANLCVLTLDLSSIACRLF